MWKHGPGEGAGAGLATTSPCASVRAWEGIMRALSACFGCLFFWLVACEAPEPSPPPPPEPSPWTLECPPSANPRPAWLSELVCPTAFSSVAIRPNTAVFANASLVKFVIDLQDDNATYFVDGARYDLHYHFCSQELEREGLDPVGTHAEFNQRQYRSPDRRFLLGTIAFYADQGVIALEFATGDAIQADQIRFAFSHIQKKIYFGDELVWRPISGDHERIAREGLQGELPTVFTADLYEGISYQPLNPAVGYGTLRLLGGADASDARPTEVVVLQDAPNDIPPVGGLITEAFQTPLSHVNVLSQNRGTPNMALRGALTHPELVALEGQLVRLEVTPQRWSVAPATLAEAEAFWDRIRPSRTFTPPLDLSVEGLPDLRDLDHDAVNVVGAKAANLAELARIQPPLPLPRDPFAIPFVHYWRHMERHGLHARVDAMLDDPRYQTDAAWRAQTLAALREDIASLPMDVTLRAALHEKILGRFGVEKVRFRSSTNSEDLPGFNGAGLYISGSVQIGSQDKAIEEVARDLWASLWSDRAVAERDFYRIDHRQVAMAILVHPAFPDEAANGVAFTTNPFNTRRPAHYVNAQFGEVSVVNPDPGVVGEQYLLYTWYDTPEIEYLSRSSLADADQTVLRWEEVVALSEALTQIHQHFRPIYSPARPTSWGMDVEFKFLGPERRLLIKQARPIPQ
jgi:hypothetical protein